MKVPAAVAVGTAILAGVLSLVLAVPSYAADPVPVPKPTVVNPTYNYGFDYYKNLTGGTPAGPSSPWPRQTVNVNINPSTPGAPRITGSIPSSGGTTIKPAPQPLTGKIIEPGKTIVKAPTAYKPVAPFTGGALGLSRLLGTAGVGIGGTSTPPANATQIALSKGVPQGCIDAPSTCTKAQRETLMMIGNCGQFSTGSNTCSSIGAVDSQGAPFGDWWKDTVIPFAADLWAKLTGQGEQQAPPGTHIAATLSKGCIRTYGVQFRGENNITIVPLGMQIVSPRDPSNTTRQGYWDAYCSAPAQSKATWNTGVIRFDCIDTNTGLLFDPTTGSKYGSNGGGISSPNGQVNDDGTNKFSTCQSGKTLYAVRIQNEDNQATIDGTANYGMVNYAEYTNPDATLNTIEDTRITTSWTCQGDNGAQVTYSKSVSKVAGFVDPQCPPGSNLLNHKIEESNGPASSPSNVRTLDQGAADSAAASAYPLCAGPGAGGCAMKVQLDGTDCSPSRTECQTWPSVSSSAPSRVTCKWGTYTVPTSDCLALLPNAYKSEVGTVYDPHSQTWTAIDTYGNPIASNPQPWNPTNPAPAPGTNVGTPTTPGTGTSTGGFPSTGTNPSDTCVPGGWSWNPVDWVKNPVICALQEAFVPKTDIGGRIGGIITTIQGKPPLSWFVPVWGAPSSAGCPNWNVNIPGMLTKNVVCESSFTAAIVGARGGLFGIAATAMVWPLIRGLWYAAIPILRVQATSSR